MNEKAIPQKGETKKKGFPQIKKWLPRGALKRISADLDVSYSKVSAVLRGESFDRRIFKALLDEAVKEKQSEDTFSDEAVKLLVYLEEDEL